MTAILRPIWAALSARIAQVRYPTLTVLAATLFAVDLLVPDVVPLVDEILLAILTAALASWKADRAARPARRPAPTPHAAA